MEEINEKDDSINYSIYYKRWHNDTEKHYENYAKFYAKTLIPLLPESRNIRILDLGCGTGLAVYALNKAGYLSVKGIDISNEQIETGKSKGLNVEQIIDSDKFLSENEGQFDLVISLDVIEHISVDSQIKFCRNIYKALTAQGLLILTTPNANSTFAARWRYNDWTHRSSFTESSIEFVLLNAKFKQVSVTEFEFQHRPKYPFIIRPSVIRWLIFRCFRNIRRMQAILELGDYGRSIPLSLNLLAVAKK